MNIYFKEERIQLLPEKAAYLPQHRLLIIADLHLGKAAHFRKAGIIIPSPKVPQELLSLSALIKTFNPKTIVFLGDLFHSKLNKEWAKLEDLLEEYGDIRFFLTKGNHDILPTDIIEKTAIKMVDELAVGPHILCSHEPLEAPPTGKLNIAGHIHPGISVKTKSRQHYRLPCFYHFQHLLILPAFGKLTGLHLLKKRPGARVFPVLPTEVIEWT